MARNKGIELPVAALRCLGFTTKGSCAGHEDRKGGPYVDIETPRTEELIKNIDDGPQKGDEFCANCDALHLANNQERFKLFTLLQEFYTHRIAPYASMLVTPSLALAGQGSAAMARL